MTGKTTNTPFTGPAAGGNPAHTGTEGQAGGGGHQRDEALAEKFQKVVDNVKVGTPTVATNEPHDTSATNVAGTMGDAGLRAFANANPHPLQVAAKTGGGEPTEAEHDDNEFIA